MEDKVRSPTLGSVFSSCSRCRFMLGFFLGTVAWGPCRSIMLLRSSSHRFSDSDTGWRRGADAGAGGVVLVGVRLLLGTREEGSSVTVTDRCVSGSGPSFWSVAAIHLASRISHVISLYNIDLKDHLEWVSHLIFCNKARFLCKLFSQSHQNH